MGCWYRHQEPNEQSSLEEALAVGCPALDVVRTVRTEFSFTFYRPKAKSRTAKLVSPPKHQLEVSDHSKPYYNLL